MKKWLFNFIPKKINRVIWGYNQFKEAKILSYSQSGEDAILFNFFSEKITKRDPGFFIDIGAFHPIKISNTYLFHKLNWKGINIDPRPGSMEIFNKLRPNDINLEIAIADKNELLTYFQIENHPEMNSFSEEFINQLNLNDKIIKRTPVKTYRLEDILSQHLPEKTIIDFLTLDVEGVELKVLQSNNWNRYRPKLLAVELHLPEIGDIIKHPIYDFLKINNYVMVAKTYDPSTVFFKDNYI